jgi:predicted ATP-dependent serine protease
VEQIESMSSLPALIIVDSIQTMRLEACLNAAGTVTQVRESAVKFVQIAKTKGNREAIVAITMVLIYLAF